MKEDGAKAEDEGDVEGAEEGQEKQHDQQGVMSSVQCELCDNFADVDTLLTHQENSDGA